MSDHFTRQPWREAMQYVSLAIDETFGEPLTFVGCVTRPNYPAEPDPSRPEVEIRGEFFSEALAVFAVPHGHGSGTVVSTQDTFVSISLALARVLRVRRGDRFVRVTTGELYEAKDVQSDDVIRVRIPVALMGRPKL